MFIWLNQFHSPLFTRSYLVIHHVNIVRMHSSHIPIPIPFTSQIRIHGTTLHIKHDTLRRRGSTKRYSSKSILFSPQLHNNHVEVGGQSGVMNANNIAVGTRVKHAIPTSIHFHSTNDTPPNSTSSSKQGLHTPCSVTLPNPNRAHTRNSHRSHRWSGNALKVYDTIISHCSCRSITPITDSSPWSITRSPKCSIPPPPTWDWHIQLALRIRIDHCHGDCNHTNTHKSTQNPNPTVHTVNTNTTILVRIASNKERFFSRIL